ncbi:MAG: cupin domain-containing protein [Candidatus Brocadiia bacterium]
MEELGAGRVVRPEEVETLDFPWGHIRILSEPRLTGARRMTFALVELAPGQGHDRHDHPDTEEIIYVVSGEGEQTVDDAGPVAVRAGAAVFVPDGAPHSTRNTGQGTLRLLVVYAPTGPEDVFRSLPECTRVPSESEGGELHLEGEA